MDHLLKVCFSNQLEMLFQGLKRQLFNSSHPFTKRLVVVPNGAMKSWVMLQMAQDPNLGIAAGVEIGFIEPTINRLFSLMHKDSNAVQVEAYDPSELEIAFALESAISEICENYPKLPNELCEKWHPLLHYLGLVDNEKILHSKRSMQRTTALASALAKLFLEYGKYGGSMLSDWKKGIGAHWQHMLWEKLEERFALWNYSYRKLSGFNPVENDYDHNDLQIHVFGLSYLAPLHHRFLSTISKNISVNYYVVSPCQKFWSDILSEKERHRLQRFWDRQGAAASQQEALEEYLRDNNPFLANFGRMGRELVCQLDMDDYLGYEQFALPASIEYKEPYSTLLTPEIDLFKKEGSLTLLEAMQADIVLLRNPEAAEKVDLGRYDRTVQVHAVPKPVREVQVIYDIIMSIIEKHAGDTHPLTPSDILVMAPNVADYSPFIQHIFESQESQINVQVMDLPLPSQNRFIQAFLHLLQLATGRWDASSLLRLFDYPSFRARHQLVQEDIQSLSSWIKGSRIRWGKDSIHRSELLKRDHGVNGTVEESWSGTWEHGMGRLIEGLAMISQENQSGEEASTLFTPLGNIDIKQGELLGKVLKLLNSLYADLKPLIGQKKLTLKDWTTYLKCLCDSYFKCSSEEDEEGSKTLAIHLDAFKKSAKRLSDESYAFHTIQRHLEQALQTQTSTYRESNLQAVRFCSIVPMRAIPAKVVILMGMHEGALPRADQASSLNLLLQHPKADYYPSQVDFDRYLFLEALLSSRSYFIMTYASQAPGDADERLPSLLITELLAYLDKAYTISEGSLSDCTVYRHPLIPFHQSYYTKGNLFKSYSKSNYAAAVAQYHPQKRPGHVFLDEFKPPQHENNENVKLKEQMIDLRELTSYCKNPLKSYFNKFLEVYLDGQESREIKNEEDFLLSFLDKSALLKQSLLYQNGSVLTHAEKTGLIPRGPFKAMETKKIKRETLLLKQKLLGLGIHSEELFSIEFNEHHQQLHCSSRCWKIPSLCIDVPTKGKVKITGRLDMISKEGLILIAKDSVEEAIKHWPNFLVLACLIKTYALPIKSQLIFAKEKISAKDGDFQNPEMLLGIYLDYFYKNRSSPSPLLSDCVESIYHGSADQLRDKFQEDPQDEYKVNYDEYLNWMKRNSSQTNFDDHVDYWQMTANTVFSELMMSWYPQKKSDKVIDDEAI